MSHTISRLLPGLWALALLVLLSGCLEQSQPATLHSLQLPVQPPLSSRPFALPGLVLLMPVQAAPHLQGRNLLVQRPDGEAQATSGHLWTATLDRQIGQRMTVALQQLLATDNIAQYPGPRYGVIGYQVEIELQEFSGDGHSFTTQATYTISDMARKTILRRKTFHQQRTIDKADYSGYVASASQALADLSREVAINLQEAISPVLNSKAKP